MVTRETVHISLTLEALHGLEVKVADVLNAYVMVPNQEKVCTVLGSNLGIMLESLSLLSKCNKG